MALADDDAPGRRDRPEVRLGVTRRVQPRVRQSLRDVTAAVAPLLKGASESGCFFSVWTLAKHEGVDEGYVLHMLRFILLPPKTTQNLLAGGGAVEGVQKVINQVPPLA